MGGGAPAEDMPKEINISSLSHKPGATETRGRGRTGTRYLLWQNAGAESDSGISVCNQSADMCLQNAISSVKPNVPLKGTQSRMALPNIQKTTTADCDVERSEVWSERVSLWFVYNWGWYCGRCCFWPFACRNKYVTVRDKWRLRSALKPKAELIHL